MLSNTNTQLGHIFKIRLVSTYIFHETIFHQIEQWTIPYGAKQDLTQLDMKQALTLDNLLTNFFACEVK